MFVREYDSAYQFAQEHEQRWLASGVKDGGALNLGRYIAKGTLDERICLAIMAPDGQVLQTAFVDSIDQICFSRASHDVLKVLVNYLDSHDIHFPGIFAPHPSSSQFAELYCQASGKRFRRVKQLKHYELRHLSEIKFAEGRLREAMASEQPLLVDHNIAFQQETNTQRPFDSREEVRRELVNRNLYVWERPDGTVVSSGRIIRDKTVRSGEVSWIYTPKVHRKQGYGTTITYMLSKTILESGKEACFLSADAADPRPNRVYTKIGYEEQCLMDNMRQVV